MLRSFRTPRVRRQTRVRPQANADTTLPRSPDGPGHRPRRPSCPTRTREWPYVLPLARAVRVRAALGARVRVDLRPPDPGRLLPLVVATSRPDPPALDDPDVHD